MEMNNRFWVFRNTITASFAKWAVRQSPYVYPAGLEKGLKVLDEKLSQMIAWDSNKMAKLSIKDMLTVLGDIVKNPVNGVFMQWNTPRKNKNVKFLFTSRYDKPRPDYDFIDLDALIRNTVTDISREHETEEEFDRRIEQSCRPSKRRKK